MGGGFEHGRSMPVYYPGAHRPFTTSHAVGDLAHPYSYNDSSLLHRRNSHPTHVPYAPNASSRPPSQHEVFTAFGHYPSPPNHRPIPSIFKIHPGRDKNVDKKPKQLLACLFCRERKIGCTRPAEDESDQTCKSVSSVLLLLDAVLNSRE